MPRHGSAAVLRASVVAALLVSTSAISGGTIALGDGGGVVPYPSSLLQCPPSCALPSEPWPAPSTFDARKSNTFPDPFMTPSGDRVNTTADWAANRPALIAMLERYMYGTAPGRPAILHGEKLNQTVAKSPNGSAYATLSTYCITIGPSAEHVNNMTLWLYTPLPTRTRAGAHGETEGTAGRSGGTGGPPYPTFVFNSPSEDYYDLSVDERRILVLRGYAIAEYNRVELRADADTDPGSIQRFYPASFTWGTIAVWAWGGARTIDFLTDPDTGFEAEDRRLVDPTAMMAMGHSRGGKTALWEAALDERVRIAVPLMSGEAGCGSFRVPLHTAGAPGAFPAPFNRAQDIRGVTEMFPDWFADAFAQFAGKDTSTPWDQHFVRALVAPRAQLGMEGHTNYNENPEGSQATYEATKVVYEWMGKVDQIAIHYHDGKYPYPGEPGGDDHAMSLPDFRFVADFADYILRGVVPANGTKAFSNTQPWPNVSTSSYRTWGAPPKEGAGSR